MIFLTGIIYPSLITLTAKFIFPEHAAGSLLLIDGKPRGSTLIAQNFNGDKYFWPRPSAINFDPLSSGGSNLGPISKLLKEQVENRSQSLSKNHAVDSLSIPSDLLFASGSGLDPHISPHAAYFQIDRIAKARSLSAQKLREWTDAFIEKPTLRLMGSPRVNVLMLNQFLDANTPIENQHE
jgi:K+-transporting ATPase ATPase C chain